MLWSLLEEGFSTQEWSRKRKSSACIIIMLSSKMEWHIRCEVMGMLGGSPRAIGW